MRSLYGKTEVGLYLCTALRSLDMGTMSHEQNVFSHCKQTARTWGELNGQQKQKVKIQLEVSMYFLHSSVKKKKIKLRVLYGQWETTEFEILYSIYAGYNSWPMRKREVSLIWTQKHPDEYNNNNNNNNIVIIIIIKIIYNNNNNDVWTRLGVTLINI